MIAALISTLLVSTSAYAQLSDSNPVSDKIETRVLSSSRVAPPDFYNFFGKLSKTLVTIKDLHIRTANGAVVHVPQAAVDVDLQELKNFGKGIALDLRNIKFPDGLRQIAMVELDADVRTCGKDGVYTSSSQMACRLCTCTSIRFAAEQPFVLDNDRYLLKVDFEPLRELNVDLVRVTTQKFRCRSLYGTTPTCTALDAPVTDTAVQCELVNRRQSISGVVRVADEF